MYNFLQRTPFFRLTLALVAGIVLYNYARLPDFLLIFVAVSALLVIGVSFLIKSSDTLFNYRWTFGAGVSLLLFALGYWLNRSFEERNAFSALGEKAVFQVELVSAPIEKANSYQCKVKLLQKMDTLGTEKAFGRAMVYLQKDTAVKRLLLGDKMLVSTEFKTPDGVQNPDGFDYARYLKQQGILAMAYVPTENWQKSAAPPHVSLFRLADITRNHLLDIFRRFGIRGDEFAVLAALTLGYTDELQTAVIKSYSATGAMHILSVSGLHVGIVYVVFAFLLGFLDKTRRGKILKSQLIILLLWIYAFLTGLSPAVTRAAFMFSFVSGAECFERKSQIYNTVFASAFLMLVLSPNSLYNIGFQLSYSAVLSIVFFQPTISKMLYIKNKFGKWTWDLVAVSVAAQLGTAPFTLYYFHQFPNFFLLTNLVAIPLSTLVIYLAIALLALFKIPLLSTAVAFLLKWSIWLMNFLIVQIQELPFSVSYISLDYMQLVFAFAALFLIVGYFYYKKFPALAAGLSFVLLITATYACQKYKTLITNKIIVFSDSRVPIVNFIRQGENYVFTTDTAHAEKIAGNFWKNNLLDNPVYLTENQWLADGFVSFGNQRIYILTDNSLKNKTSETPLPLDYLILSNKIKPKMESILACVQPRTVVVDKSISAWYTNHVRETCQSRNIRFYSVAEKGAFVLDLKP